MIEAGAFSKEWMEYCDEKSFIEKNFIGCKENDKYYIR